MCVYAWTSIRALLDVVLPGKAMAALKGSPEASFRIMRKPLIPRLTLCVCVCVCVRACVCVSVLIEMRKQTHMCTNRHTHALTQAIAKRQVSTHRYLRPVAGSLLRDVT